MTHDTVRHPIQAAEHEAEHLREIVEEGESETTLAILVGTWIVVVVILVAVVVTAALLIAYLVTH
jgi:cobalamin biosynthesis protein CobD/CbiB